MQNKLKALKLPEFLEEIVSSEGPIINSQSSRGKEVIKVLFLYGGDPKLGQQYVEIVRSHHTELKVYYKGKLEDLPFMVDNIQTLPKGYMGINIG